MHSFNLPCEFHAFTKVKVRLRGHCFDYIQYVQLEEGNTPTLIAKIGTDVFYVSKSRATTLKFMPEIRNSSSFLEANSQSVYLENFVLTIQLLQLI